MAVSETHDLGRLYVHGLKVPTSGPLVERGTSHEVETPWRVGRCVVLRVWKWAAVVGWWGAGRTLVELHAAEVAQGAEELAEHVEVPVQAIRDDFRPEDTMGGNIVSHGWVVR